MKKARLRQGKSMYMSLEEINVCCDWLDEISVLLQIIKEDRSNGPYMTYIRRLMKLLNKVIDMDPTEEIVLEKLNDRIQVIQGFEKRKFSGSAGLGVSGVLIAIGLCFFMGMEISIFFLLSTGLYLLTSMTPDFLIAKRKSISQSHAEKSSLFSRKITLYLLSPLIVIWAVINYLRTFVLYSV